MKVSVLMCFYERPFFLPLIAQNLLTQTYILKHPEDVEVIIADDSIEEYRLDEKELRTRFGNVITKFIYIKLHDKLTIGQKRNLLCSRANHDVLIFMDDDDYYFPSYIEYSVNELKRRRKVLVGSNSMLFTYVHHDFKKLSINCVSPRQIHEATMCLLKSHWKSTGGFADKGNGEGASLIDGNETKVNGKLDICKLMVCLCHERNTCQKDMFLNIGTPAEFPFPESTKELIKSCLSDPLYGKRTKICFKYPTRQRPEQFKSTFQRYFEYLSWEHEYQFVISMDNDDTTMNNEDIRAFLDNYRKSVQIEYYYKESKNKIDAINRDMIAPCVDIIVLVSDDMIPQVKGFDKIIVEQMKKNFPDYDGMLNFNDGLRQDWPTLCTLTIYGIKYYRRFNYIYHPDYESVVADIEQTQVGRLLKRIVDIDQVIIRHEWTNPIYNDELRSKTENAEVYQKDRQVFETRLAKKFDIKEEEAQQQEEKVLTVIMVTHDVNLLPSMFEKLPSSLLSDKRILFQAHFAQIPSLIYTFDYMRKLCLTVLTPFVTFYFPNEKYRDNYTTEILPVLLNNNIDIVTFDQQCSLDNGKTHFILHTDMDYSGDEVEIPMKGPWNEEYTKRTASWNVFRVSNMIEGKEFMSKLKVNACVYEFMI
jgi:Glycosyl transferase family 2